MMDSKSSKETALGLR